MHCTELVTKPYELKYVACVLSPHMFGSEIELSCRGDTILEWSNVRDYCSNSLRSHPLSFA